MKRQLTLSEVFHIWQYCKHQKNSGYLTEVYINVWVSVWGSVSLSVIVLQRKSFKCKIFPSIVWRWWEKETPENFTKPVSVPASLSPLLSSSFLRGRKIPKFLVSSVLDFFFFFRSQMLIFVLFPLVYCPVCLFSRKMLSLGSIAYFPENCSALCCLTALSAVELDC